MSQRKRSISTLLLSLAVACAAATSCDDEGAGTGLPSGAPPLEAPGMGLSVVRVLHASPDLPTVDIYVDDETSPLFSDVSYGDATEYASIPGRDHVLHFRTAQGNARSAPLFSSQSLSLPMAAATSLVATGLYEETTHDKALRVIPVAGSLQTVAPGKVRVHVLHGGVDASTLELDVDGDDEADITGLDRFEDSGEDGLEVPAGVVVRIQVTTDDPAIPLTSFTLPPQPAGSEVLVVVTGLLGVAPRLPTGFSLVTANEEGSLDRVLQDAVVYLLNTVSDLEQVDIFLDSKERVDSLAFGALSDRIQVSPAARSVDIFAGTPTGSRPGGTALVSQPTSGLKAGEQYLLVIAGPVPPPGGGSPGYRLLSFAEAFDADPDRLRMRLIHAAPGLRAVDMGPLDAEEELPALAAAEDLPFTQATDPEGLALPPVEFTLGLRLSEEPDALLGTFFVGPGPLLSAGVFAVLAEDGDERHLLLVSTSRSPWTVQDIVEGEEEPVVEEPGSGGSGGGGGWSTPPPSNDGWKLPRLPPAPAVPSLPRN
ncbi:DUF4397 domain-containing protein [Pyxidicoccus xibeiensis]|uniref:DUF4397 domain-containing protein n=1 Tax=Pyxidicoccus xibeiensis TaxID=2906759 RepID=UPI0020A76B04|nr:DUF4397 domain-containing protein [Pyxidicoccus xibeiensis]MCP3142524.1 DUF4397 domain-containing protein [Pyxidicoccus xibeiensis]